MMDSTVSQVIDGKSNAVPQSEVKEDFQIKFYCKRKLGWVLQCKSTAVLNRLFSYSTVDDMFLSLLLKAVSSLRPKK